MAKKSKGLKILFIIALALVIAVMTLISAFLVKNVLVKSRNEKAAKSVITQIDDFSKDGITIDDEAAIISAKANYDNLNNKQKSLVTNASVLEEAVTTLQGLKDKKLADELIAEINKIDKTALTHEDTTVNALIKKYDGLSDSQKALVTNYQFLLDCKDIVDQKIEAKRIRDEGIALAENFEGFKGKWGDFGAHVNSYQGMIEEVIREDIDYKKIFSANVNSLEFNISRFEKNTTVFGMGICYFSFTSKSEEYGFSTVLYGEIIIKEDGTLYATTTGYY